MAGTEETQGAEYLNESGDVDSTDSGTFTEPDLEKMTRKELETHADGLGMKHSLKLYPNKATFIEGINSYDGSDSEEVKKPLKKLWYLKMRTNTYPPNGREFYFYGRVYGLESKKTRDQMVKDGLAVKAVDPDED